MCKSDTKKPYTLGEHTARKIEAVLNLPVGWMDSPDKADDATNHQDSMREAMKTLANIPDEYWPLALALLKTIADQAEVAKGAQS
jgi:hypothetical protein